MVTTRILGKGAKVLPRNLRALAKKIYYRNTLDIHPKMKKFGTVQDLYYWASDGDVDTLLLLQNYFSAFFPTLDTSTEGSVSLYDKTGEFLGRKPFFLGHCASARFRVSSLLEEFQASPDDHYGTLEVHIGIPQDVLEDLKGQPAMYFWDRFYICYTNALGHTCFVHGVDKTHIFREGKTEPDLWYPSVLGLEWAPEMPVNMDEYKSFSVIMVNRSSKLSDVTLTLTDTDDVSLSWIVPIPPGGVHRYDLTGENTASLAPQELRMRVAGMATRFGRPAVFKQFRNGAISAMHC